MGIAVQNAYEALRDLGFSADQIVQIVSHHGGSRNIEAVQNAHQALIDLGFSTEQIVRMVSHDGGSINIEAIQTHGVTLRFLRLNTEQISILLCRKNGTETIDVILSFVQKKLDQRYSFDYIAENLLINDTTSSRAEGGISIGWHTPSKSEQLHYERVGGGIV